MNIVRRKEMTPAEISVLENTEAQAKINQALIDYNIMMGNIEDPAEEEEMEEFVGNDEAEEEEVEEESE